MWAWRFWSRVTREETADNFGHGCNIKITQLAPSDNDLGIRSDLQVHFAARPCHLKAYCGVQLIKDMHDSALAVIVNDAPVNGVHERQQNAELPREPLSDIDVLIVGAGLGGLNAAVEVYRQGHNVRLIEAKSKMEGLVGTSTSEATRMQVKCTNS